MIVVTCECCGANCDSGEIVGGVCSDCLEKKLRGPGWKSIDTGIFIPEEDAYSYALERLSQDEEEKQEFVDWFYSGNYIRED